MSKDILDTILLHQWLSSHVLHPSNAPKRFNSYLTISHQILNIHKQLSPVSNQKRNNPTTFINIPFFHRLFYPHPIFASDLSSSGCNLDISTSSRQSIGPTPWRRPEDSESSDRRRFVEGNSKAWKPWNPWAEINGLAMVGWFCWTLWIL